MQQQEVCKQQKKKPKDEQRLEFNPGKVFGPEEAKAEDFELKRDGASARYKARHGEGGDRNYNPDNHGYDEYPTK